MTNAIEVQMRTQIEPAHIHDVLITHLKKVVNPRGHLMEVQRADEAHYPGLGRLTSP